VRATSVDGNVVRLPPVLFQPIVADDVAAIVAETALAAPRGDIVEIAVPERAPFNEIVGLDEWLRPHRHELDTASEVHPLISPARASGLAGPRHSRTHSA